MNPRIQIKSTRSLDLHWRILVGISEDAHGHLTKIKAKMVWRVWKGKLQLYLMYTILFGKLLITNMNMWSRRSAIERCPSPWNRIRSCPTVTDNGLVKGTDILLKQILCSNIGKSLNIIALHWPVICYCWAFTYSVSRRRASLDRRSTTPHVAQQ